MKSGAVEGLTFVLSFTVHDRDTDAAAAQAQSFIGEERELVSIQNNNTQYTNPAKSNAAGADSVTETLTFSNVTGGAAWTDYTVSDSEGVLDTPGSFTYDEAAKTLAAEYNYYAVTFHNEDGTTDKIYVLENGTAEHADQTRENHTFRGWSGDPNAAEGKTLPELPITAITELYPVFAKNPEMAGAASNSVQLGSQAGHVHGEAGGDFIGLTRTGGELEPGSYCLEKKLELTDTLTITGETTLCLNGQTLDCKAHSITIGDGGRLTLCDCSQAQEGLIKGGVEVMKGGALTLEGGRLHSEDSVVVAVAEGGSAVITGGCFSNKAADGEAFFSGCKAEGGYYSRKPAESDIAEGFEGKQETAPAARGAGQYPWQILKVPEAEASYQETNNGEWKQGTLADAVANVYNGGTVKLPRNVNLTEVNPIEVKNKTITVTSGGDTPYTIRNTTQNHNEIFQVTGTARLTLEKITLDGGKTENVNATGPLVSVGLNCVLTLYGATLQNNHNAATDGGGVSDEGGKVSLTQYSVIQNCSTAGNGGGVRGFDNGLELQLGSEIRNCSAGGSGGGIYCINGMSLEDVDIFGALTGNTAGNGQGHAIYYGGGNGGGKFTMKGEISSTAETGAEIYLSGDGNASATLTGGTINARTKGSVVQVESDSQIPVEIGGEVRICNSGTGALVEGGDTVTITGGYFSNKGAEGDLFFKDCQALGGYFSRKPADRDVAGGYAAFKLGAQGITYDGGTYTYVVAKEDAHVHEDGMVFVSKIEEGIENNDGVSLLKQGGNYYLDSTYSVANQLLRHDATTEVNLCLYGQELSARELNLGDGTNLCIYDCSNGQKGKLNVKSVNVDEPTDGTKKYLYLYGGNITGGVSVEEENSFFYMYGGSVASVTNKGGKFYMHGGTVKPAEKDTAINQRGGESYVEGGEISSGSIPIYLEGGSLAMSGGTLSGRGTYINYGATLNIEGNAVLKTEEAEPLLSCESGGTVNITGGYFSNGGDKKFFDNCQARGGYFSREPADRDVESGCKAFKLGEQGITYGGGIYTYAVAGEDDHVHEDGMVFKPLSADFAGGELGTGSYYLGKSYSLTKTIEIAKGAGKVNICLHGGTVKLPEGCVFSAAGEDAALNLYDCTGGGRIEGQTGVRTEGSAVNFYGGMITNSRRGVEVQKGTFRLCGGTFGENSECAVYLGKNQLITIGKGFKPGGQTGISVKTAAAPAKDAPVPITGANDKDYSGYFVSADGYEVKNGAGNVLQLSLKTAGSTAVNQQKGGRSGSVPADLKAPETGDAGNMALWLALMAAALAGACGTVRYSRKKKAAK